MLTLVLGKHNLTAALSSYSRPEVITKSQSYFFPHSVKTMAVTATAKGITSRQLLIGTIGDQVRFTNFLSKYLWPSYSNSTIIHLDKFELSQLLCISVML